MHQYSYSLFLQITHPIRDLTEPYKILSQIPGFTPGRIWKVNEPRLTPTGNPLGGSQKESYCYFHIFSYPDVKYSKDETLPKALESIIERLYPKIDLLKNLTESGGKVRFHIGWHHDLNVGEVFDPELLRKLAELSIGLIFDIYYYSNKSDNTG